MSLRAAYLRLGLCAALVSVTQACAEPRAQAAAAGECRERIVVGFVAPVAADAVANLAVAQAVRLVVAARLLPDLYVLDLAADGACTGVLERVRADPTVRSAELDSRRGPH
jgi:hypothetical protein